ncbi:MAG: serine protease AprX, partial [Frankiaceae bacterium]|nr:serine protease AprX [Frankiaceae bacterium]
MGITWNVVAPTSKRRWFRGVGTAGAVAVLSTTIAATGVAVVLHRDVLPAPVGVGASPWFADPGAAPDGSPTLPDLASVEQVVNTAPALLMGATGQGIDVAVLDSGVTPVAGLSASNKVVYGPDLSFDSQTSAAYLDGYGHGTVIASIIGGNDGTAGGFQGVAPGARIISVKVGASNGAVDVSQIIAGIDWVTAHAHDPGMNIRVLNISLGTDSTQSYQSDPLAHAAEAAWRNGIVVVAAVGNTGSATRTLADPAADPYVMAVGSEDPVGTIITTDDVVSPFSARGTSERRPDIVAPGSYVLGLRAPGSTLDLQYPAARVGDRYLRGSGTSQATAVVSGAVADVLSARPNLTPDRVKKLFKKSATSISGGSNYIGAGLINVGAAVGTSVGNDAVQTWTPSPGAGSLELARGSTHVASSGVTLTGEQDIFGNPWSAKVAAAEETGTAWTGGTFNGATWSGATWSGATWSGATWSGATWSGATWS